MKRKHMRGKNRPQRQPDEAFTAGSIKMHRFGRQIVSQANWSAGEFEDHQARLVAGYDKIVQGIDQEIARAAALVAIYDPLAMLHRAWWDHSAAHLGIQSEVEIQKEHVLTTRMLDYLQSLIVSTPPIDADAREELDEAAWAKLVGAVDSIFQKLNPWYFVAATAKRRHDNGQFDAEFEEFHFRTQLYWCNVTGEQYQNHNIRALRELLGPQSFVIERLYGLSSDELCSELGKIWSSLTTGIGDAVESMEKFRQRSLSAVEMDIKSGLAEPGSIEEQMQESIARHGLSDMRDRAVGLFFGLDLFDLQKVTSLPVRFLEDFSWSPGQDNDFFGEGEFKGWPLRIWPTFKRPFIAVGNKFYCFDQTSLFDHFYRQLEKKVFSAGNDLKQFWIDARKDVTESLPFDYFTRLLPKANYFKEVYYWLADSGSAAKHRFETDGFLTYDDHLFIVEVKSGAFTYTDPATDIDAHVQSLKNLVADPAKQGNRFLRYLRTAEEVPILDESGKLVTTLRLQDFRQVTIFAISLDPFTEIAAQVHRLPAIGVAVGDEPILSMSLDDLRVYADIFTNPVEFLHFVEQRKEAFKSVVLQLDDELDHLGLYLKHNHYARHFDHQFGSRKAHLQLVGYREEIDKFFSAQLLDPQIPPPLRQKMPRLMAHLLDLLQFTGKSGRSLMGAYLLDMDGDGRNELFSSVAQEIAHASRKRPRPYSAHGEVRLTAIPWTKNWAPPDADAIREHVKAIMILHNEPDRILLELEFDDAGELVGANWQNLQHSEITIFEQASLEKVAESIRLSRLPKASIEKRRIGRNDPCPCGSGVKYKKCCID